MERKNGKDIAQELSDFTNSMRGIDSSEFAQTVTSEHRYLQQEMFDMFFKCIENWAKAKDANQFDQRNEYAVKASKVMIDALKREELY